MSHDDASKTLRGFAILSEFTNDELQRLAAHLTPIALERGDVLFREGDHGDAMFFVYGGIAVAERALPGPGGQRKDLALLAPSSVVGEMALADDSPRSASVRAELPLRAYRLSRDAFQIVQQESQAIAAKLFRALFAQASERLRATNEQLLAIFEVGRELATAAEPLSIAESVLHGVAARLDARSGFVALYDADRNDLRIAFALGPKCDALLGVHIPLDSSLAATAFDERRPLLVERLLGATEPWEASSMLLAPLVVRDVAVGVLGLSDPKSEGAYGLRELSLLAAVANVAAPVLLEAFR